MKNFSKVEPIKSWSAQWMIDNNLQNPFLNEVSFTKTHTEKAELKLEKLHNKLAKQSSNYQVNQDYLLAAIAKSKPNFNIVISKL